jgi:hypothetical protein
MGVVGVKIDIPHCSVGSSVAVIGLKRWSFSALYVSLVLLTLGYSV